MIRHGVIQGHPAVWLDNGRVRVAVLPGKGADIYAFIHLASGVEFLMRTPVGLKPPGGRPPQDFLENYEGGWQELFPNHNDACTYRGRTIPFHGEVALLPWKIEMEADNEQETVLVLSVDCHLSPFRLTRCMRLPAASTWLEVQASVVNLSDEPEHFVWGQHIVLGGDFLMDGCRLDVPASRILTPDELYEPATAILAPGQDEPWPTARGRREGETVDLRAIPGPEAHSHDDVGLTGLTEGRWTVTNPRLALGVQMEWDLAMYPWLQVWQPYGGAEMAPLTGIYGLGLEPWVSRYPLAEAVEHGEAHSLGPGERLTTALRVGVLEAI